MTKYKLEYIWLDGKKPIPELRGKTQLKSFEKPPTLADLPLWGFDGSSTMQAEGSKSDCILKPVALYPDAARKDGYLVLCEVMHPDGTPHSTNCRATIEDDPDFWVGLEQEYFLYKDGRPLGFPKDGHPTTPQGPYYCGVGYKYMGSIARQIVDEHLELCLTAGINHEGINAEVAKGQWEFQIFAKGSKKAVRRHLDGSLSDDAPVREIRSGSGSLLQAHQGRLERIGHAHQLLNQVPPRSRWQGIS